MRHHLLVALGHLATLGLFAQTPSFISAWQPAGQPLNSEAVAVTTDAAGNVYTVGHFMGTGDFDPGPGIVTLSSASAGTYDVFVTKMDVGGQLVWARRFGSAGHEWATAVVVDDLGGVITCGRYNGIADMDPGPATVNLDIAGGEDIFVQKLDANGLFVHALRYGSGGFDAPYAMVKGPDGMIYLCGTFTGQQVPFGGFLLSTAPFGGNPFDNYDGFILKMDADGGVYWAERIGGNVYIDRVHDIAVDDEGNILFVGTFASEEADFGPTANDFGPDPIGLSDAFVCKWNPEQQLQWLVNIGGDGDDIAIAVTTDAAGNCYVTGTFDAACDFDLANNGYMLPTAGGTDVFIAKYDTEGLFQWAKRVGGSAADEPRDIALLATGRLAVAGLFRSTVDMDPGSGTQSRTSAGGMDLFLLGLRQDGTYAWDMALGSAVADLAGGLHSSATGEFFAVGLHGGDIDFDPGPGTALLAASGARAWALRLGACTPVDGPVVQGHSCGSPFSWNGNTYTQSGTYQVILESATGCDSTVTLQLEVLQLDNTVAVEGITLTALQTGVSYQWVDCIMAGFPVEGATGQSFTPGQNGSYAVSMVGMGCSIQSECIDVLSVGVDQLVRPAINIFPVPAGDHVLITGTNAGATIMLIDAQGRTVRGIEGTAGKTRLGLDGVVAGAYIIRVSDMPGMRSMRIVVQ